MAVTSIPIRSVLERLGHQVDFDPETKTIRLTEPATGRTGTIQPGSYTVRQGRAYINPADIASWLRPGLPSAAVAAYTALDQIPTMNEVIKKAQADYAAAQAKGDRLAMQRAHQAAEAARAVGSVIGFDVRPADVLNPVKRMPTGERVFDSIAQMWQIAASLPWAPGTKTLKERQEEREKEQAEKRLALDWWKATQADKTEKPSKEENKAVLFNRGKQILDELWQRHPRGPSVEAVFKKIYGFERDMLGTNYPILTRGGLNTKDVQDVVDALLVTVGLSRDQYEEWKKAGMPTAEEVLKQQGARKGIQSGGQGSATIGW